MRIREWEQETGARRVIVVGDRKSDIDNARAAGAYAVGVTFGMGSVEAWRFTQRLAGVVLGGLGLILSIVMLIVCISFRGQEIMPMVENAVTALIWQAVLTLVGCLGVNITAMILFDSNGEPRRKAN